MPNPSATAQEVAREINRVTQGSVAFSQALGGDENLRSTVDNILSLDTEFESKGGVFFKIGENASDTAEEFTRIHVEQNRNTARPSLPALAIEHAKEMGIDKNSPGYKAMITTSALAEMEIGVSPEYHNKNHFADVTAMTANLIENNDNMLVRGDVGAVELPQNDKGLLTAMAAGHDVGHKGASNPKGNHYANENKSFNQIKPLLEDAGYSAQDIDRAEIIIKTTSPDGPHAVLKQVAAAHRNGEDVDWNKIDPEGKFDDLKPLANDPKLTQMAAMLSDADLYASAGAGLESNAHMSTVLSKEMGFDLTTDNARKFFLDNIVGEDGFASNSGRQVANESFKAMRQETEQKIAAAAPDTNKITTPEVSDATTDVSNTVAPEVEVATPAVEAAPVVSEVDTPVISNAEAPDISNVDAPDTGTMNVSADDVADVGKKLHGGVIVDALIGTVVGVGAYAFTDATLEESAEITFETVVPYGGMATEITAGNTEGAVKEGIVETTALAGAATGAALGTVLIPIPVVGTVVGGIVGGVGAGLGADKILTDNPEMVAAVVETHQDVVSATVDAMVATSEVYDEASELLGNTYDETMVAASETYDNVKGKLSNWFNDESSDADAKVEMVAKADVTVEEAREALPDKPTPDMPPEVESLVAQPSEELFAQQFDEIKENGSLLVVSEYVENNPAQVEPPEIDLNKDAANEAEFEVAHTDQTPAVQGMSV